MIGAAHSPLTAAPTDGTHAFVACTECVTRRGSEHCAICHLPRATHAAPDVRVVERRVDHYMLGRTEYGQLVHIVLWAEED